MARSTNLLLGVALAFVAFGCEKLIGIEDTTVVEDGTAGDSPATQAGAANANAGAPSAGAAGKVASAGSATGGKGGGASAGSANGGSSNGGASAGNANGGASAGSGGSPCNCAAGDLQCNSQCTGGCNCKAPTPVCENGKCIARGPVKMMAGSTSGNTAFYIDSTEVTNQQYAAFLTAKGSDTSGQRPECDWNKSYQPADAIGDDKRPAVNVDFCDAAAFCDWAGERLCGDLGGGPLALSNATLLDPTKSQWYLACAGPTSTEYPYGNDFKADYCNEYFSGDMADAGKFSKCEGHYSGVFDLVGNAAEWIDSCVDDPGGDHSKDTCELMGGSYLKDDYDCSTSADAARSDAAAVFGFRCCSK